MLRLKHQIIDGEQSSRLDTRAILGLDITKAFDNVKHDAVLENLEMLGVGARMHDYIQDFLNDRTAQISIGGTTSDDIMLGGRGTPQGSVLSPYLFNVAMIGLPEKQEAIGGLHHSIYTDDITLWVTGDSDGFIQDTLQEAIRAVESYVEPRGLACSPQKSELLLLKPIPSEGACLYDFVMVYARALKECLALGRDYRDGRQMFQLMKGRSYKNAMGYMVLIDEKGHAQGNYTLIARRELDAVPGEYGLFPIGMFHLSLNGSQLPD
ncbi:hypothetical protein ISCGN_022438 [Ixodes scapularis]